MPLNKRLFTICSLIFFALYLISPVTSNAFNGFTNKPGSHIELTETAFKTVFQSPSGQIFAAGTVPIYSIHNYRWKPNLAVDLLAEASRDTDLYYFGPAYPHAQTHSYPIQKTYSNRQLEDIEARALRDYLNFMLDTLDKVRRSYETGNSRIALYRLGFYLHGYEDLFAHQGITNQQHLWLEKKGQNPDTNSKSIQECRGSLLKLAGNLPTLLGPKSGNELKRQLSSTTELKPLSANERRRVLGRNPDIYWEGIKYKLTSSDDSCSRYLKQIRWDYPTLARLLNSRETLEAAGKIRDLVELKSYLKEYGYRF